MLNLFIWRGEESMLGVRFVLDAKKKVDAIKALVIEHNTSVTQLLNTFLYSFISFY